MLRLWIVLFALIAELSPAKSPGDLSLTVVAEGFRNDRGKAVVMLYDRPGTIPDKGLKRYAKRLTVPISHGRAIARFRHLAPGRYAVSLFHDENGNGIIDKGLMLPREGVGLSKFKSVNLFHPPSFEAASFELKSSRKIPIRLIYF